MNFVYDAWLLASGYSAFVRDIAVMKNLCGCKVGLQCEKGSSDSMILGLIRCAAAECRARGFGKDRD
jgi:hypothetical protein